MKPDKEFQKALYSRFFGWLKNLSQGHGKKMNKNKYINNNEILAYIYLKWPKSKILTILHAGEKLSLIAGLNAS